MSIDSVNVYGKHTVEVEPIPHYRALTIVLKPIEGQKFLEIGNTLIVIVNSCHKATFSETSLDSLSSSCFIISEVSPFLAV